ncbi:putative coat protein [Pseudoalteromonas virus vB_PspP-H6/1]|nr:putative coat protein [Pseudoalteromonas virus vB_PspP-H6/1]
MANNFDSNFTRKLARSFIEGFEANRVISKNVNTQLLDGKFAPDTGDKVDFKRPTDYKSKRTANGDISALNRSDIITGKATGEVQEYFTVDVDFDEADEALKMDQIDELLNPATKRLATDLELDFAKFTMKNAGLMAGSYGTAVSEWDHVAEAGAIMQASGIPMDDDWCYFANPFTQRKLASNQRSLGGETGTMSANERAVITDMFAGMKVMTATTLPTLVTGSGADRAGTLASDPVVTYVAHKDTMVQTLAVAGMQANLEVKAGEKIQIAGRNRLNLATRQPMIDETGAVILFTGTVAADVTLSGTGTGNITVTGPAIYEADGAYNTVDSAPVSGDVVTLLGSASTLYQPNLFWHKQAFSIGSVPIKKLYSTDTIATTEDGLQIRVSKYADGDKNKQIVRFDLRPAYAALNPFFGGHGFGRA